MPNDYLIIYLFPSFFVFIVCNPLYVSVTCKYVYVAWHSSFPLCAGQQHCQAYLLGTTALSQPCSIRQQRHVARYVSHALTENPLPCLRRISHVLTQGICACTLSASLHSLDGMRHVSTHGLCSGHGFFIVVWSSVSGLSAARPSTAPQALSSPASLFVVGKLLHGIQNRTHFNFAAPGVALCALLSQHGLLCLASALLL